MTFCGIYHGRSSEQCLKDMEERNKERPRIWKQNGKYLCAGSSGATGVGDSMRAAYLDWKHLKTMPHL